MAQLFPLLLLCALTTWRLIGRLWSQRSLWRAGSYGSDFSACAMYSCQDFSVCNNGMWTFNGSCSHSVCYKAEGFRGQMYCTQGDADFRQHLGHEYLLFRKEFVVVCCLFMPFLWQAGLTACAANCSSFLLPWLSCTAAAVFPDWVSCVFFGTISGMVLLPCGGALLWPRLYFVFYGCLFSGLACLV